MTGPRYSKREAKAVAREKLRGIITAPYLAITETGDIDEAGLRHDVRHCLEVIGSSGLYVNGFYGHFWLLSSEQRRRVAEIVVDEVAGRVPVICRCAHQSPAEAVALAKHAEEIGADFISLVAPTFGGADRDIVLGYVSMVAEEIELGITVFNTPQVGYAISPELMADLAEIPNVCGLKNQMPIEHTTRVRELVGHEVVVIDPEEENLLVQMTEHGQQAIYTGVNMMFDSGEAQPMKDYVDAALAGRFDDAAQGFDALSEARRIHADWILAPWSATGLCPIAIVKYWSGLQGMTGGPAPRPLPDLSPENKQVLLEELVAAGAIRSNAAADFEETSARGEPSNQEASTRS